MQKTVGIRFKPAGKIYHFDPKQIFLSVGDNVIVETARGLEYGNVASKVKYVPIEEIKQPIKPVIRKATEEDELIHAENLEKASEAYKICREQIVKHGLEMKLIRAEYTFDGSKIIFYFTADGRIDFRELVKDLAGIFRIRIELRQIGVRDEAKMLGGIGCCGKSLCCHQWLGEFQPVSIKMAKEQGLSLNPSKISGICGRLLCCLKYEHEDYECVLKQLPKIGANVMTPDGEGSVYKHNILAEKVAVKLNGDDHILKEYAISEIKKIKHDDKAKKPDEETYKKKKKHKLKKKSNNQTESSDITEDVE